MIDIAQARARFEQSFAGEIFDEMVRVEVIDRALALASKLFVAVIPLSIILKALVPGSGSFGQDLVVRFGLSGPGASATRTLFASGSEVRGAVSVIGVVIVLYSVLSFTRALQRVYLNVWRLHPQPFDALARQVAWIVGFVVYSAVLSPLHDLEHGHGLGVLYTASATLLGAAFWVWSPYVLLGRRIRWRRMLPTGLLTAAGISIYSVWTALFLPAIFTNNAERYGLIGIAFGLVTWLFAYAGVVIVCAVLAGVWDQRRELVSERRLRRAHTSCSAATSPPATASASRRWSRSF
jgi:membrane protein